MAIEIVAPTLQARLLGDFYILREDESPDETPWERYDMTSQVLKFLLLQPRLRCHPSLLVDAFWPEVEADKASERLQFHVKRLRTLLHPLTPTVKGPRLVALDKTTLALDAATFTRVDALEFTAAATRALANEDVQACRAALSLYGGELLPRDLDREWTRGYRRELAERRRAVLGHAARLLTAAGETSSAIPLLTDLLADDPCDERAARLLMQCYVAEDERAEAARAYHTLRAHLQEELHVLPSAKTEEIYTAIRREPAPAREAARPAAPAATGPAQRRRRPRPTELARLFGRDEELSYADLLLGVVQQRGGCYALFVAGEAGVGKTHLAHEMLNRARRHGYTVLAGFARAGGSAPYAPVVEALRTHAAAVPEETLRAALSGAPGATALLPEIATRLQLDATRATADNLLRHDLVHAVAALAADQPAALLIDDLHDADAATVAWLGDLLLAGSAAGLLVIATLRAEPAAPPALEAVIEESRRRGTGETLSLHGVSLEATPAFLATLLGRPPAPELVREMHEKTRGNPFLISEIVRELRTHGMLQPRGATWSLPQRRLPVPESVRGLARARLNALDEEARRLVALAAVADTQPMTELSNAPGGERQPSTVALLAQLGGWSVARTLDLLDRLVAAGIFEEREGYRFRHGTLREAIYELLGAERRALLHATVATTLEQNFLSGAHNAPDIAELAHHFLLGGPSVAAQAADYATLAGDRAAALFAHHEAVARYRDALEHAAESQRAQLQERLGVALAATGEHSAAVEAFEAALQLSATHPEATALTQARLLWYLGTALAEVGRHADAAGRLAEAEATLRAIDDEATGGIHALLFGRVYGARARLALATVDLHGALVMASEALRWLELAPEATLDRLEVRNALAGALFHRGQLDEAHRYIEEQLVDAQALGHPAMLCRLHANRALILLLQGHLTDALAANEQATAILGNYHDAYRRTLLLAGRGEILAESGAWDDAIATLDAVVDAAEREGWPQLATRAHAVVAVPLLARGQAAAAQDHLERCLAMATRPGFGDETPLVTALVHRAALYCDRGDLDEAACDLARAQEIAQRLDRPQESVDVQLGLSCLCAIRRQSEQAEQHACMADEIATAHGFELYHERAMLALARALRARDQPRALHLVETAIVTLRAREARPYLVEALELQVRLLAGSPAAAQARDEAGALRRRLGIGMS